MSILSVPDPGVDHAQRSFRALLHAMAYPGTPVALPAASGGRADALAMAATLVDVETTFAVVGAEAADAQEPIRLRTGARIAAVEQAGYACLLGAGAADALRRLPRGTLVDPSAGATAFWAPSAGTRVALELSGPGIKDAKRLVLSVDDEDMVDALLETRTDPPRGVDVAVFPGDGHVIGLPRTTRLEVR